MAAEDKDSKSTPIGGIAVLLLVAAGVFIKHQWPFESARPAEGSIKAEQSHDIQDIDARLWEDPFAAVARHQQEKSAAIRFLVNIAKEGKTASTLGVKVPGVGETTEDEHKIGQLIAHIREKEKDLIVIGAMVSGTPYPDDVESRRRSRYAVLAGLDASGYVPVNNDKIGFFQDEPSGNNPGVIVPFEFFEKKGAGKVLLLWLAEERLGKAVAAELLRLRDRLVAASRKNGSPDLVVIGPATSTMLKSLIAEAQQGCNTTGDSRRWVEKIKGRHIEFYSPGATAIPADLLPQTSCLYLERPVQETGSRFSEGTLQGLFPLGIQMVRTINNDGEVTRALAEELRLRGVKLGPAGADFDQVVLVSEWDTDYGRNLPEQFIAAACGEVDALACRGLGQDPKWVTRVSYMRGLDGGVPSSEGKGAGKEQQGKADRASDSAKVTGANERADGTSQYDYLRRLALTAEERALEKGQKKRVKAVGVLGSDPYDKLLVLQALRPQFPEAVFFTTDLDGRLLQPSQHEWTRNLLIGSGHGLELNAAVQAHAPPFRSTYQTAAFLAVRLALEPSSFERKREKLNEWLLAPHVYEVGRTGAFALQPASKGIPPSRSLPCKSLSDCGDIRPPLPFFSKDPPAWGKILAWALGTVTLVWLLRIYVSGFRDGTDLVWEGLHARPWAWGVVAIGVFVVAWVVSSARSNGLGEPFAWIEGISLWPTELIRIVAILCSACFIVRTLKRIKLEPGKSNGGFFLEETGQNLRAVGKKAWISTWRQSYRNHHEPVDADRLWGEYRGLEHPCARLTRLWWPFLLYVVLIVCVTYLLGDGRPVVPFRGELAKRVDFTVLSFAALTFLVLLFLVVDAIRLGSTMIDNLSTGRSIYPVKTMTDLRTALNFSAEGPEEALCDLLDIRLIGAYTDQLNRVVYFPFVVLALMVVARSSIFDNWYMSPTLFTFFVLTFLVIIACAFMLQRSAGKARDTAVERVTGHLMRERSELRWWGSHSAQLEMMLEEIKGARRGAFLPFFQQPIVKAFLVPAGSFGGLQLLEYSLIGMPF